MQSPVFCVNVNRNVSESLQTSYVHLHTAYDHYKCLATVRMAYDCSRVYCKYAFLTNIRRMFVILRPHEEFLRTPTNLLRSLRFGAKLHSLARLQAYLPRRKSSINEIFYQRVITAGKNHLTKTLVGTKFNARFYQRAVTPRKFTHP